MAVTAATTEPLQSQPTTREQRGRQIAQRGGIRQLGARYVVPAQSANSNVPTYLVDVVEQTCTCPDYALRQLPCKHYEACMFWFSWTASGQEDAVNVETEVTQVTLKKKQQSKQNWPAYNRAQTTERLRVPQLLHALFRCVPDAMREAGTPGQKPIPTHEALFGLTMKVASGCSGRRAEADMHAYVERGYLSRAWDANTLFRAMENEALAPLLTWGIEEAAGVLAPIANKAGQIAIDATGFRTTVRRERDEKAVVIERWHDQKHKKDKGAPPKMIHDWVKLHAATDTLTNIVTAAKVTAGTGKGSGDCPHFIELLHTTNKRFTVKEVSGDKGYLDKNNLSAVAALGALPFVAFKDNSRGMEHPNEDWRRMYAYFDLKKEEFLAHYHRRSNVETTFGGIKKKFGPNVSSKKLVAQQNEVLAKVLLWNLGCIVHAIEEFGVEAEFSSLVMP